MPPKDEFLTALDRARSLVGRRGECHCTGECIPDPTKCPAYGNHLLTFSEWLERAATWEEIFNRPEIAQRLREEAQKHRS